MSRISQIHVYCVYYLFISQIIHILVSHWILLDMQTTLFVHIQQKTTLRKTKAPVVSLDVLSCMIYFDNESSYL